MGNYPEAIAAYQKGLKLEPDSGSLLANLGLAYSKSGDFRQAVRRFMEVAKADPHNPRIRTLLAMSCYWLIGISEIFGKKRTQHEEH